MIVAFPGFFSYHVFTLIGSNYPCIEQISIDPKMSEPLTHSLSIHWLERTSINAFSKRNVIAAWQMTSTSQNCGYHFDQVSKYMLRFISMNKTKNVGTWKVCKKKNLSLVFGAYIKLHPRDYYLVSLGKASWGQTVTVGTNFSIPAENESFLSQPLRM